METYRLGELGLPKHIGKIAASLNPLSQMDLQQVATVFLDSQRKWEVLQKLLQSEMQTRSPMLDGLKKAETVARLRMQVCLNIKASWRKLPLELWDRIFLSYLDATRNRIHEKSFQEINRMATQAPGTISLVCKFWQALTHAVPSIWKDVTIPAVEPPPGSAVPVIITENIERIFTRLNRIAVNPHSLSLTISVPLTKSPTDSDGDSDAEEMQQAQKDKVAQRNEGIPIHSLLKCHPGVRFAERVCLDIPAYRREAVLHLGTLEFCASSSVVIIGSLIFPRGTTSAHAFPAVKKAVLVDAIDYGSIPSYVPWAQLTHLFLGEGITLKGLYQVLGLCGSLIQGAFFVEDHPEETPTALPTTLYHLTGLSITRYCLPDPDDYYSECGIDCGTGVPDMPCANVSFPALQFLRVFGDDVSFATFGNLTRLTAVGVGFPYKLDDILNGCPLLSELVVSISLPGKEAQLDPLVYNPDRPKGALLQIIALRVGEDTHVAQAAQDPIYRERQQVELKALVADMGVEVSVQAVSDGASEGVLDYRPRLDRKRIRHWDSGVMDIFEDKWEFTTSIGPTGLKTLIESAVAMVLGAAAPVIALDRE
ncbi:hypothetical protein NMY22_g7095 [Coprinellus aureogranulatus]|nr:hypothetical protein NMY22_g7095 [Coprinellus aureogranulatus]